MRVTVVGYGSMGGNHVRVLRELGNEVTTLDPRNGAAADHQMLTEELIDWTEVACIATPIDRLSDHAEGWLRRGKDVLLEKPGTTSAAVLAALHGVAVANGCRLLLGYVERHNPAVLALAEHLHLVGRVRHIEIRRLGHARDRAGDPLFDLATHDLDVLDYLGFTLAPTCCLRSGGHLTANLRAEHEDPLLIPGEPSVTIEASHLHPFKRRELEIIGDDGVLQLDYHRQALGFVESPDKLRTALGVTAAEPLQREWEAFASGFGSDGTAALEAAEWLAATELATVSA